MGGKEETVSDDTKQSTKNTNYSKLPNILRPGYVAPDGGWGWMIVIAAGFSNLCTLSLVQSFGLIFRAHFEQLGINAYQSSTIINVNSAIISCVGLTNGPLFRKYSVRQVACVGALVCTVSITALSFMKTFPTILFCYAVCYATGNSLSLSSSSLALNMYFKKKKRLAIGLAWTLTGISPIILPQLVTTLLPIYDVSGTILLFGGIAFNALVCALLLQPVGRHARKESESEGLKACAEIDSTKETDKELNAGLIDESSKVLSVDDVYHQATFANRVKNRLSKGFRSQYLYYDDEQQGAMGLDVVASEAQMMSRANDGWYSKLSASNASLSSNKIIKRKSTQETENQPFPPIPERKPFSISSSREHSVKISTKLRIERETCSQKDSKLLEAPEIIEVNEPCKDTKNGHQQTADNREMFSDGENTSKSLLGAITAIHSEINDEQEKADRPWHMRALHAIHVFFDLDLLRDPVYVNSMIGVTLTHFADINFFVLTPFILSDIGVKPAEVANVMSVLAVADIITRLVTPFIASRIGWENRIFFMISMAFMAVGRILFAHVRSYNMLMATAVLIGAAKAFRTIFFALVIPSYIPLERLAAATGIQLAASGIIFMTLGPIVGWIRDSSDNYTVTLHCLNIFPCLVVISWTLEIRHSSMKRKLLETN